MKKVLSIVLSICMLLSITAGLDFSAFALESSGKCGNSVIYTFNSETGLLTISGSGAMYDYLDKTVSPFYGSDVEEVIVEKGVTSVGKNAFCQNAALKSVSVANSVKSIGDYAFYGCTGLTSIEIPNSVTNIGGYAFYNCEALASVEIPNSIKYINEYTFYACSSLKSIEIPNSVRGIREWAFNNCNSLESVKISNGVGDIGFYAFRGCSSLTEVSIPDSVNEIGADVFQYCTNLKTVYIGSGINFEYSSFGRFFEDCPNLESVYCFEKTGYGIDVLVKSMPKGSTLYAYPKGNVEYYCIGYGINFVSLESKIACDFGYHNYSSKVTTKATCTKTGIRTYTCKYCSENYTENIPLAAHTIVVVKGTPATFKAAGKTDGKKCSVCQKILVAQKPVAKLGAPSISKVSAGKKQFKATWKAVAGVDGYEIRYATSTKALSKAKPVAIGGYKSTSKTVKKLKAKKKYFVQIRAYKTINGKKQYSAWSKSRPVTTKK
jgi:hypothetical protein